MSRFLRIAFLASTAVLGGQAGAAPLQTHKLVVEIVATPGATLLDFAGPAEAFGVLTGHIVQYVVSDETKPFKLENGVVVSPDYTFDTAPKPDIVVIGSQPSKASDRAMAWLRGVYGQGGTVMSVCTGADWLGQSGLLDGRQATTHGDAVQLFQDRYATVKFVHGKRYVESQPRLYTAGGYTAGMDLALHVIDQRFGRPTATEIARRLEYQGQGWLTNRW